MKKIQFIIVLLIVFCGMMAHADTIEVESKIDSVTVFNDRALVIRKGEVSVSAGEHELVFSDLPIAILDNSLRAEGGGTAKAVITGLCIDKIFLEEPGLERIKELKEEIEAIKDEIKIIEGGQEAVMIEKDFLESLKVHASEKFSDELTREIPSPSEFSDFLKFLREKLDNTISEFQKLEIAKREKNKKLNSLEKQLAEIQNWQPDERKKVSVGIDVKSKGKLEVKLFYITYGATWLPSYSVRAFPERGEVEITYLGIIRQKTGEEWQDVKLSLSTAKPAVYAKMPELSPWYLRKEEARTRYKALGFGGREPARSMMAEKKEVDFLAEELEEASVSVAEVQQKGTSVSYNIAKKENVPSDGNKYKTAISINTFPVQVSYITTPELSEYVYLKAEVENNTDLHYLAGEVDIFMGQDFIGHSDISSVAPTEKFDLYLGIDEGLKIEKELEKEKEEEKGLIGKTKVISYKYKITAENYKDKAQELIIKDRVPVSQNEDIIVKIGKFSVPPVEDPEKKKEFEEKGLVEWQISLEPKEKKEIIYSFIVSYPRDMMVEGL